MTEQPPAVPLPGPNVTPEPNEKIKVLAGVKENTSSQGNTLARRDGTALPSLSRPNVAPEPNEKIKVLASNSTVPRHRERARRLPSESGKHRGTA